MASFELFVFEKVRTLNLAGLTLGLATVLLYQDIDSLVLPESAVPLATFIRFWVLCPLFLATIYFCLSRQSRLFLISSTTTVLASILWWFSILLTTLEDSLLALFAVTIQFAVFSNLLLHTTFRSHLMFIGATAIASTIAVLMCSTISADQRAVFSFGIGALLILCGHWAYSRNERYKAMYQTFQTLQSSIQSRDKWNKFLGTTVDSLRASTMEDIRELLTKSEVDGQGAPFLKRAKESADEASLLMERFSRKTDWSEFSHEQARRKYSIESHLTGVISELSAKSLDSRIVLHNEQDFDVTIDRELLTRLITNLVENALRFAKPGTAVDISILKSEILVIDNIGPPLSRPFDQLTKPGAQSDKPGQFGLGLYVCSKICKTNGIELTGMNTGNGVRIQLQFAAAINKSGFKGADS